MLYYLVEVVGLIVCVYVCVGVGVCCVLECVNFNLTTIIDGNMDPDL